MKTHLLKAGTALAMLAFFLQSNAQTAFWAEDFGTGCDQGNLADGYATTNGTWAATSTGTNASHANRWYISATEAGLLEGDCGDGCLNNSGLTNRTLHLGNIAINAINLPADQGAAYYSSSTVCTNLAICGTTNKRVESPTIDCSNQDSIMISFLYMEGSIPSHNATLEYYDGNSWQQIDNIAKSNNSSCNPQGKWTAFSTLLPASADSNANVQIGFNWTNDENDSATDPSFAVDSIVLWNMNSSGPPPTADFTANNDTICEGGCVDFTDQSTGATSWSWTFNGGSPGTSTQQNPTNICYTAAGTHDVKLVVSNSNGSDSITYSIEVEVCPGIEENSNHLISNIFPNPVNAGQEISLVVSDANNAVLNVYSLDGKQLNVDYQRNKNKITVPGNQLSAGAYMFEVVAADKSEKAKVIIR